MSLAPRSILLIVAVILFLLAAFSVALGTIQLVPLGLRGVRRGLRARRWRLLAQTLITPRIRA